MASLVRAARVAAALAVLLGVLAALPAASLADACTAPVSSPVACENTKPGVPESQWLVSGSGDPSIQGYATTMSVNKGGSISFKIDSAVSGYTIDILRIGYYGGDGARMIATNVPHTFQTQPACQTNSTTGLIDCGNWAVSATWAVPSTVVSGVYIARLVRTSTGGASVIPFVVRDDAANADLVVQTSDETWQAYNPYGGNSLYTCTVACPPGNPLGYKAAYKVSYNRPFSTAGADGGQSWLFTGAEYPMIRFIEASGYNASYISGVDANSRGSLLLNHKAFISSGHDEYWSAAQRTNVTAARDAGVSLAFFSGNEMFWKTRFEPSTAGTSTPDRTLVAYKDTHFTSQQDPVTWTGTWRDPRYVAFPTAGNPENALTGQFFLVNSGTSNIQVPSTYKALRLWRNTAAAGLAAGQSLRLGTNTLGYEWDIDFDNGFRPPGQFQLSSTTVTGAEVFTDYGSTTATGTATHNLTSYRAPSGALVFGAGTVQWAFGLDDANPLGTAPDNNMRQATVNLLADMGAQPFALLPGLVAAAKSTDTTKPTSTITSPAAGATINDGTSVTITGTASDAGGGVVAGVEVSTDGGTTWHAASGTTSWAYSWIAHGNPSTVLRTRAVDDSGNLETPSAGRTVNVSCPCTLFGATTPVSPDSGDNGAIEVGVKFTADTSGQITGIRFYKVAANTGTHIGSLWTTGGTRLAQVTFTGESGSGWQSATFATPVAITAGTTYVASYYAPNGRYASTNGFFYPQPAATPASVGNVDSPPLHALRSFGTTTNGVYSYSASSAFPASSFEAENYWVDVTYQSGTGGGVTAPGQVTGVTATAIAGGATVSWTPPSTGGAPTTYTVTPYIGTTAQTSVTVTGSPPATSTTVTGLTPGTAYTFRVTASNSAGAGPQSAASNSVTPLAAGSATNIFGQATPAEIDSADPSAVELGVKFTSDVSGLITGIRFYKATANTGTHIGSLWTTGGTRLAQVTFSGETASGWQTATFASPVAITAGTTYVASYFAPNGHYSDTSPGFTNAVDNSPLHALANSASPNGVYSYGSTSAFPVNTFNASNYFVDVVFSTSTSVTAPGQVTGVTATAIAGGATVSWTAPSTGGAPTTYTVTPYIGTTAQTSVTVTGSPPATTRTVTGLTPGTAYTFRVTASNAGGSGPQSAASNSVTPLAGTATNIFGLATPAVIDAGDGNAVELGVKFRSDVSGRVTGIRFYKATANTGTHIGSLWTTAGTRLAQVTFAGETASGWQTATLATPVSITAGTTYVASYFAPRGHYSVTAAGFTNATDNPPLHALATATSPDGVYTYGSASAFPVNTFNANNYWVDVAFSAGP